MLRNSKWTSIPTENKEIRFKNFANMRLMPGSKVTVGASHFRGLILFSMGHRLKGITVEKAIVYGTEARQLGPRGDDKATHEWTCYVRGADYRDISYFVKKVVFTLHPSFDKPVRSNLCDSPKMLRRIRLSSTPLAGVNLRLASRFSFGTLQKSP